jgi:hypothetical protein
MKEVAFDSTVAVIHIAPSCSNQIFVAPTFQLQESSKLSVVILGERQEVTLSTRIGLGL